MPFHVRLSPIFALSVALAAGTASSAQARPVPPPHPPLHQLLIDKAEELGVTSAQRDSLEALAEANASVGRAAHRAMKEAHDSGDAEQMKTARVALEAHRAKMEEGFEAIFGVDEWADLRSELPPPPQHPGR